MKSFPFSLIYWRIIWVYICLDILFGKTVFCQICDWWSECTFSFFSQNTMAAPCKWRPISKIYIRKPTTADSTLNIKWLLSYKTVWNNTRSISWAGMTKMTWSLKWLGSIWFPVLDHRGVSSIRCDKHDIHLPYSTPSYSGFIVLLKTYHPSFAQTDLMKLNARFTIDFDE